MEVGLTLMKMQRTWVLCPQQQKGATASSAMDQTSSVMALFMDRVLFLVDLRYKLKLQSVLLLRQWKSRNFRILEGPGIIRLGGVKPRGVCICSRIVTLESIKLRNFYRFFVMYHCHIVLQDKNNSLVYTIDTVAGEYLSQAALLKLEVS